jgi:hypothetical protein
MPFSLQTLFCIWKEEDGFSMWSRAQNEGVRQSNDHKACSRRDGGGIHWKLHHHRGARAHRHFFIRPHVWSRVPLSQG